MSSHFHIFIFPYSFPFIPFQGNGVIDTVTPCVDRIKPPFGKCTTRLMDALIISVVMSIQIIQDDELLPASLTEPNLPMNLKAGSYARS